MRGQGRDDVHSNSWAVEETPKAFKHIQRAIHIGYWTKRLVVRLPRFVNNKGSFGH
jgi:hypothetical protein